MRQQKLFNASQKKILKLYAVAKQEGELPEKEREELRLIITTIFEQKMNKHSIK